MPEEYLREVILRDNQRDQVKEKENHPKQGPFSSVKELFFPLRDSSESYLEFDTRKHFCKMVTIAGTTALLKLFPQIFPELPCAKHQDYRGEMRSIFPNSKEPNVR